VQHLQLDNVKVGAAGDRGRAAGATAVAGEKSKERDAKFGKWLEMKLCNLMFEVEKGMTQQII
jgi:hypothetical protein